MLTPGISQRLLMSDDINLEPPSAKRVQSNIYKSAKNNLLSSNVEATKGIGNQTSQKATKGIGNQTSQNPYTRKEHKSLPNNATSDGRERTPQPNNHENHTPSIEPPTESGYNKINRRRLAASNQKKEKVRKINKTIIIPEDKAIFVLVNEKLQPYGNSQRKMSSLIGCLVRDPNRIPLEISDWRKVDKEKIDIVWREVKRSYKFPEGREPYEWVVKKMAALWRQHKCEQKIKHFDGKSHGEAIAEKPTNIPEDTWLKVVEFWESPEGQARSERDVMNKSKSKMCHYAGSKTFSSIRAE